MSEEIRSLYNALLDIRIDAEKAREKDHRITARITDITSRIETLKNGLADLSADAEMDTIAKTRATLDEMEKKRRR